MTELAGKRALVTGGSRGIGAAIATALAEKGASVAITYERSADRADQVVRSIVAAGGTAIAIQADSADPAAVKRSVDDAATRLGGLDILVNNAGIARYSPIADFPIDDIDAMLAVNVRGPILAAKVAIPHLGAGARIISIGSGGADRIVGAPGAVYYMTKSALQSFTRGLAQELGAGDITVNLVPARLDQHGHESARRRGSRLPARPHPARPLWSAGGCGGSGRLSRIARGAAHHGRDHQRRWRCVDLTGTGTGSR